MASTCDKIREKTMHLSYVMGVAPFLTSVHLPCFSIFDFAFY